MSLDELPINQSTKHIILMNRFTSYFWMRVLVLAFVGSATSHLASAQLGQYEDTLEEHFYDIIESSMDIINQSMDAFKERKAPVASQLRAISNVLDIGIICSSIVLIEESIDLDNNISEQALNCARYVKEALNDAKPYASSDVVIEVIEVINEETLW